MTPVTRSLHVESTALFEKMADSVACYERDGIIAYVNPATCEIFGRPREALIGQVLWLVLPESRDNGFHHTFEHVARTGETQRFEHFHAPWGRWYDNHVYLADERIWVVARDITQEKQAARRLDVLANASRVFAGAASDVRSGFEGIARHVAELIGDMCSIRLLSADRQAFEAPLGIWDVNPSYRELLRDNPSIASSEAVGLQILKSGKPFVMSSVEPHAIADQIAPSLRSLVEQLGVHSAMVVPLEAEGQVLGVLGVCRRKGATRAPYADEDLRLLQELAGRAALVVNQWRTLERVEDARQQLAMITDALPVLVCLVDDQLCYRFVNAGYERWFGQTRASLIGKSVEHVLGAEAFAAVEPKVRSALAGNVVTFEASVPYAVAGTRHIRSTNTPYRVDGKVKGYIALVQDISVEKAYEAELRAAIAARDEFLSIASHELRTPLTALSLQLDGLERTLTRGAPSDERAKTVRKVGMALRQADRLASLIDGLLNVSRIADGRFRLELQAFDMVGLVHEVAQRFDEEAERVGSVVSVNVPDAVLGRWDRSRVDQALTNLLSNALKYGAGRPVGITLVDQGERVQVAVRDEGIGIALEDRERVLGRFERAVSSSHYGGLGLGLYIANEIVCAHGGSIGIDSQLGRGATFTLSLPRQR